MSTMNYLLCEINQSELPFQAHVEFKKADLDSWQDLYCRLVDWIWSPDRLGAEEPS